MSENATMPVKAGAKRLSIYLINILLILLLLAAIGWGVYTYLNLDRIAYTNDAQVEEYINPVNSRIPGYIKSVLFQEHQLINKGDTLVLIDDSEYRIALEQAEAAYSSALAAKNVTSYNVNTVGSGVQVSDANLKAAEARLWNANQNYQRYEALVKEGAATRQQFDQVKTEYEALNAQAAALRQQQQTANLSTKEAGRRLIVNDAEIKRAHAAVEMARLNLSYTVIRAPYGGITGRRAIQEGQLIQAGQNLLTFVRNDNKWIVANYKERQLGKIKIGQKVKLRIDALNDAQLYGTISAIAGATGSRYSMVPVDNSTGNFVKVQQRIPVKIHLLADNREDSLTIDQLRAGMNAEVELIK
jgi:membrane fusion protein (multidrug efflux system)